ncbi:MAG: hypothetical protein LBR26_15935 [Prevotella sp.]|jgi:hypothetical protein|nr:hypothetical protein [Prevotella sp.]
MQSVVVPLHGIDRSKSDLLSENGDMDEVINLRHKNGSLQPFGEYQTLKDSSGADIDVSEYETVFLHKTPNFEHFIVLRNNKFYYLNDNVPEEIENFPDGLDIPADASISSVGNIIDVSYNWNSDVVHFYLLWEKPNYAYMDMSFITPFVELTRISEYWEAVPFWERVQYAPIGVDDDYPTKEKAKEEIYNLFKGHVNGSMFNLQAKGWICGNFTWMYAIKLYDGSYIKTSPLFFCSQVEPEGRHYVTPENPYPPTNYDGYAFFYKIGYKEPSGESIDWSLWCEAQLNPCKLDIKFGSLEKLKSLKDIILSIDIFMSPALMPVHMVDNYDLVEDRAFPWLKSPGELREDYELKSSLFKVKSFELADLDLDAESQTKELRDFDFNNLTLGEAWNSDFDSYANTTSRISYVYNAKIHKAGIISKIANIFPFKYNQDQPVLFKENQNPDIPPVPYTPASSLPLSMLNPNTAILLVRVLLKTDNGEASTACVRYFHAGEYLSSDGEYFNKLGALLSYPDARAYRMQIVLLQNPDWAVPVSNITDVPLKPHPSYNLAYYLSPDTRPVDFGTYWDSLDRSWLTPENLTETRDNIIKVSEVNNAFTYPTENTYMVGSGSIVGLCANTRAVSTGQFGEYPLYAFCSDGIYALGLGGGDVDYSSIRPVSRDVCDNPDSITPIDSAIVFSSNRGLLMIAGDQVTELSTRVKGTPFKFKSGIATIEVLKEALDNDQLVHFLDAVSEVDFNEYVKGAKTAFIYKDNRELTVSNPDYGYSYVFSLESQAWTKTDFVPEKLITNYPLVYGLKGGRIYNLADEKPAEHKETFFLTRPLKLFGATYIRPGFVVMRGVVSPHRYSGLYIFGSVDGLTWRFIGGEEYNGAVAHTDKLYDFINLGCYLSREKMRYIRFAYVGNVKAGTKIDYFETCGTPVADKSY